MALPSASSVGERLGDGVARAATAVKPRLRGWIHAGMFPLVLAGGIVLIALSPTTTARVANTIFAASAVLLFGMSAVYHRGNWSPRTTRVLRRFDHSNIFLIIAGTYTPLAALLLTESRARVLLWVVWGGAILGLLARVFWLGAPRWLYVPIYLALGWIAVAYMPQFWRSGGPGVVWALIAGGAAYTLGAVVYGLKRPNPSPQWFGFHELFHALTVVGFWGTYVSVSIATYALR